jgi:hypothetical protein
MTTAAIIGLDIAKTVFQVHGVDAAGQVVVRRRLTRGGCWRFLKNWSPVLSGSKPAALRTIGRGNSSHAGTRFA